MLPQFEIRQTERDGFKLYQHRPQHIVKWRIIGMFRLRESAYEMVRKIAGSTYNVKYIPFKRPCDCSSIVSHSKGCSSLREGE